MLVRATVCLVKDLGFGVSGLVARQALGDRLFKTIVLRVNGMSALRSFECRVVGLVGCKGFGSGRLRIKGFRFVFVFFFGRWRDVRANFLGLSVLGIGFWVYLGFVFFV